MTEGLEVKRLKEEILDIKSQYEDAISVCLWIARRVQPVHKEKAYDFIDNLTGGKNARLSYQNNEEF